MVQCALTRRDDGARGLFIEAGLAEHDPGARQFNRRGEAFEWRQSYDWTWHRLFGRHWLPLLAAASYPLPPYVGSAVAAFDVAATLHWRALHEPSQQAQWQALIEGWLRDSATPARGSAPAAIDTAPLRLSATATDCCIAPAGRGCGRRGGRCRRSI